MAAECQIFKKVSRNGQEMMEPQNIKAYNVEVLPPLTDEEADSTLKKMKRGKACDESGIVVELLKDGNAAGRH